MYSLIYAFLFLSLTHACLGPNTKCGSLGYTGPNNCCAPMTCVYRTTYVSQCLYVPPNDKCPTEYYSCANDSDCCPGLTCIMTDNGFITGSVCRINYTQDNITTYAGGRKVINYSPFSAFLTTSWDCCMPSCMSNSIANDSISNTSNTSMTSSVSSFISDLNGSIDINNGTNCNNNLYQPITTDKDSAYAYASITSYMMNNDIAQCFACYELNLKTMPKKLTIQVINVIPSNSSNINFFINVPGSAVINQNCPENQRISVLYQLFKIDSSEKCSKLVNKGEEGCRWKYNFLEGKDRFEVRYKRVYCPYSLVNQTNVRLDDDKNFK